MTMTEVVNAWDDITKALQLAELVMARGAGLSYADRREAHEAVLNALALTRVNALREIAIADEALRRGRLLAGQRGAYCETCGNSFSTGDVLRLRVARLEEALRFYADPMHHMRDTATGIPSLDTSLVERDEGKRARAALGEKITGLYEDREQAEERAARAEAQCAAVRMIVEKALVTAQYVVDSQHALPLDKARVVHDLEKALASDAGRDLLTAVRRLCEAAHMVLHEDIHEERSYGALDAALADPALAGLQRTHEKVAHQDADRKRD